MRFNFRLSLPILFVILFFIIINKSYPQESISETAIGDTTIIGGEDERISIIVDSVERTDSYPERLKQPDFPGQKTIYKPPSKGNDFVFIHITIVEKRDLKIELREARITKTHLIDDRGETHLAVQQQSSISIDKTYPLKKMGSLMFDMPKDAIPVKMKYLYQYREKTPNPREIIIGEIGIDLIHIQ